MAAVLIAQNPDQHGFDEIDYHAPFVFDLATVEGPADLRVIAAAADTTVEEIRGLNPELKRWCTPPGSYDVRIPKGTREAFAEAFAKIPSGERIAWRSTPSARGRRSNRSPGSTGSRPKASRRSTACLRRGRSALEARSSCPPG